MALASIQGSSAEASTGAVDAYLVEIHRQVAESTRPTATPRYARLAAFLGFVSLATAALAVMVSLPDEPGPVIPEMRIGLATVGLVVSLACYALEFRARRASDVATASSIYVASTGFFAFTLAMAVALLLVR